MIQLACREVVFHFNKKHLEDSTIPMWVLKTQGRSFYVQHVNANVAWSTKETSSNPSTKGSIKFKNCKLVINDENEATLTHLTKEDKERLKKSNGPYARLLIDSNLGGIKKYMDNQGIEYSKIIKISGGCGTLFYICDIFTKEDAVLLSLIYHRNYRVLQPNEEYYKWYDEKSREDQESSLWNKLTGRMFNKDEYIGDGDEAITDASEVDWGDDDEDE